MYHKCMVCIPEIVEVMKGTCNFPWEFTYSNSYFYPCQIGLPNTTEPLHYISHNTPMAPLRKLFLRSKLFTIKAYF